MFNILTVDLEDWFHICGINELIPEKSWPALESRVQINTMKILNLLSGKRVKATFFVLGYIAHRYPNLIKKIQERGHEIATHGYSHRRVYTMTPDSFRKDLRKALTIITGITSKPVKGYRAPEWSIRNDSLWALDILNQEGFEYDSSMTPFPFIGNPGNAGIPTKLDLKNGYLWEFPPLASSTPLVKFPLGGGWGLRVFPYSLIRSTIYNLNKAGRPGLIYLHPREFDENNPYIKLPLIKKMVLEARVEKTEKRLCRLLDDFPFTSISAFMEIGKDFAMCARRTGRNVTC